MGRKSKKWWFPPLENKKKPHDVVTIDGDEEDFDTVMAREVSANYELRDEIIASLAKGVVNCFTDLVPDGNDRYRLEPSPELAAIYPGQTLNEIKASLEVKLEHGIDLEPVPPALEENEEEAAMMGIKKPAKRVTRSMWGPDAVFNCDKCPKTFKIKRSLLGHQLTHVNNPNKYECKVCATKFPNSVALNSHRRCHSQPNKFSCQLCDEKFPKYTMLRSHCRQHLRERMMYKCDTCNKVFKNARALGNHGRLHKRTREKKKDKNAPKRPQSAFFLWINAIA